VSPCSIAAQASEEEMEEGILIVLAADAAVYSAYPADPIHTTRSPGLKSVTEGPRETMRPAASLPRISGLGDG